jgi:hypothetical protein
VTIWFAVQKKNGENKWYGNVDVDMIREVDG